MFALRLFAVASLLSAALPATAAEPAAIQGSPENPFQLADDQPEALHLAFMESSRPFADASQAQLVPVVPTPPTNPHDVGLSFIYKPAGLLTGAAPASSLWSRLGGYQNSTALIPGEPTWQELAAPMPPPATIFRGLPGFAEAQLEKTAARRYLSR